MCACVRAHTHTHKLAVINPKGCTSLTAKPRAPLEGVVEISVSFDSEMALFLDLFQVALLGVWGVLSPGKGLSGPEYLCLCLRTQQYFSCPWGCQKTCEHPEVLLEKRVCFCHGLEPCSLTGGH